MTKKLCLVVFLILLSLMPSFAKAEADVLPLSPADLRDMTLESIPPWPEEMVLSGTNRHWQKVLHEGEFVVALYEAMPAVIDIPEPYPYDEYVRVLEGSVILTSSEGERQSYEAGDAFLVPVGWTGTWEMPTRFRELIIVDRGLGSCREHDRNIVWGRRRVEHRPNQRAPVIDNLPETSAA